MNTYALGHREGTGSTPVVGEKLTGICRAVDATGTPQWRLVAVGLRALIASSDTATCKVHSHLAPDPNCKCGFNLCRPGTRPFKPVAHHRGGLHAVATCEGSGAVIVHEDGWRTEHQTLVALQMPGRCGRCAAPITDWAVGPRGDVVGHCQGCSPGERVSRAELAGGLGCDITITDTDLGGTGPNRRNRVPAALIVGGAALQLGGAVLIGTTPTPPGTWGPVHVGGGTMSILLGAVGVGAGLQASIVGRARAAAKTTMLLITLICLIGSATIAAERADRRGRHATGDLTDTIAALLTEGAGPEQIRTTVEKTVDNQAGLLAGPWEATAAYTNDELIALTFHYRSAVDGHRCISAGHRTGNPKVAATCDITSMLGATDLYVITDRGEEHTTTETNPRTEQAREPNN